MRDGEPLEITALGDGGDGIADPGDGGAPVFISGALPGERWARASDGTWTCTQPRPDRRAPECPHFSICGGCTSQHMPATLYADWKRQRIVDALAAHGLTPDVRPLATIPPPSRRRATFTAAQTDSVTRLGYHARASHDLVDITVCPILVPAIADALDGLRSLARMLAPADGRLKVGVTATDVGLDVHVNGAGNAPNADLSARLAAHAQATGIARLIVDNTDIVQFAAPRIAVDNVDIPVPTGVFLQAAAPAEAVMIAAVCDAVGKARDLADLFCGVGTFALPLSRTAKVTAIDGESRAIAALDAAKRNTQGRKAVTARIRDLFREPLSRKELEPFEAVVIDPPRAGAKAQSEALAKSEVGRIAAVSCNPATFARDAEILAAGGYDLAWVQPIDQFVYAPHVELVAAFMRPGEKRRGGKGRGRGLRRR